MIMNDFRKSGLRFKPQWCSASLPGGDQVDGLPPAASTEYSSMRPPNSYRTIHEIGADFLKKLKFYHINIHFSDFCLTFNDSASRR